jgi:hypothetical protein
MCGFETGREDGLEIPVYYVVRVNRFSRDWVVSNSQLEDIFIC